MSRLRLVPFSVLAKVAQETGFHLARRKGSHCTFKHEDGRIVTIPDHGSKVIVRPLLRRLLRDMGLTPAQYEELLESL